MSVKQVQILMVVVIVFKYTVNFLLAIAIAQGVAVLTGRGGFW